MIQKKKKFFILIFFFVLIVSILAPLASHEYLRNNLNADIVNHTAAVVQAKMALEEGQFPLRTAPWQNNHYGNPWFQFYSPVFYTFAGIIHKFFFPQNPYTALKVSLGILLFLGTFYFYRLIFWMTESNIIGVLSAVVYITNPYLLINIFARGAITEAAGQGILPIILYYSFRIYFSEKNVIPLRDRGNPRFFRILDPAVKQQDDTKIYSSSFPMSIFFFYTSIAWFMLIGTHLLTWFYFAIFLGLFFLIFTITNNIYFKKIIYLGFSFLFGLILACYFIAPIILYTKYFPINRSSQVSEVSLALTPIFTMFSIAPTSPMPLPANGMMTPEIKLYVSLGLPVLLSVGFMIYLFLSAKEKFSRREKYIASILLFLFVFTFFVIWTPFNFWTHIPHILQICQFSYRLLAQTNWMGTFLFAIVLYMFAKNKLNLKHAILGFFILCMCHKPWITTQDVGNSISIQEIMKNPHLGYGSENYLIVPKLISPMEDSFTLNVGDTTQECAREGKTTLCSILALQKIHNIIQLPIFYYPNMLNITVNDQPWEYFPTALSNYTLVGVELPQGKYKIKSYFQGLVWSNWVSLCAWFVCICCLISCYWIPRSSRGMTIKPRNDNKAAG